MGEQDSLSVLRPDQSSVRIVSVFTQEDRRICQTEAIDGLLDVADHKTVSTLPGYGAEQTVLNLIGVLVFVHHDLLVALGDAERKLCRRFSVFLQEQANRKMFQIVEVEGMKPYLIPGIANRKCLSQRKQGANGCAGLAKVGKNELGRAVKFRKTAAKPIHCVGTNRPDPRLQVGI